MTHKIYLTPKTVSNFTYYINDEMIEDFESNESSYFCRDDCHFWSWQLFHKGNWKQSSRVRGINTKYLSLLTFIQR